MPGVRGMDKHTVRTDGHGRKYCGGCRKMKPLTDFHLRSASPDGRHNHCKLCRKAGVTVKPRIDPPGKKTCTTCGILKPWDDFYTMGASSDGLQAQCKTCSNTGPSQRDAKLKAKYGINGYQFAQLLKQQGGRCAICGTDKPSKQKNSRQQFVVDHCHVTGHNRKILCSACNWMLGCAKDDPNILQAAIDYLTANR